MNKTEVVKTEARPVDVVGGVQDILRLAVEKGLDVASMERIVALHERMSERQADAELAAAMAAFQAECPPIARTSQASITTRGGSGYGYRYAELDQIARTIRPILQKCGLSYTWDSEITDKGLLAAHCTVRHVGGGRTTATFSAPTEGSPSMSGAQKHASALTYARRQSLVQVLGLTTCDPDTDAASDERITEEQEMEIKDLLEVTHSDVAGFLRYMKADAVSAILARDYAKAMAGLRAKLAKQEAER